MVTTLENNTLIPGQTIGIIGGGQLGRMMAMSAKAAGFRIAVLDPTKNCPCGQIADIEITASYDDEEALNKLAEISDCITFEFENVNEAAIEALSKKVYIPQGSRLLKITQNRVHEKQQIREAGATVAPYAVISELEDLISYVKEIGYPCVLKRAMGGYDGKGQLTLLSDQDIPLAKPLIDSGTCVLEAWVSFEKEISVIVTRKQTGEYSVWPIAENIHRNHILHETIAPARISERAASKAEQVALQIAEYLQLVGTLAIEMFMVDEETIVINELAPRPHNSGHYTIEACETSQFEQHIRAICNWPLGSTQLHRPAVMVNVLGQHMPALLKAIPTEQDWKIHLYGKKDSKINRKMGHITILTSDIDETLKQIDQTGIWSETKEVEESEA